MYRENTYVEEYYPLPREDGVQAFVQEQVQRTPWWLISLGAHLLLGLCLWTAAFSTYEEEKPVDIRAEISTPEEPMEPDPDIPLDAFENLPEIETDYVPIDEQVIKDAEISDVTTTNDNEDYHSSKGDPECRSDDPFQGKQTEGAIGVGGGLGGGYGQRFGSDKDRRALGGGRRTRSCVRVGLCWLKNHQNPDGMWSTRHFGRNCRRGGCTGPGSADEYDMGNTGLALLSFLGAGHTHRRGSFKRTVKSTLKAIRQRQLPNGCFGKQGGDGHWIYNHLITTMAAAEAYGMTESPMLRSMAQKAVDYVVECQNPGLGWRYGCKPGDSDTSCTGWAVLALKSATIAGLAVPKEAFDGAENWLDRVTDETYYKAGYTTRGDSGARLASARGFVPLEAMTAVAVASRIFMGQSRNNPRVRGGASLLKQNPPQWNLSRGTVDMYYWYYGALAAYQLGKDCWKAWEPAFRSSLVSTQKRSGCAAGSWDPVGAWGSAGGRVYSTAMGILTLEVYYRYARILRDR
jgi:hypothetical protein